ncbi:ABC transporter permease [Adhaeribacter radiodurans]|uniref:ABC transporter permease n=1 Tax=Adhaeribacter radiodurans TaxID=2745197 RepID=A0A7L7L1P6_9BACT|nr:ABC transporter permease [Adhaeribacter radiodurans]QMU26711.1 ABC transporter permease [Adhaeribacter radiodurans]
MFYHSLKIAFRTLWRHKFVAGINLFGLALGMAACLLILQYTSFEWSYDRFHVNSNQIYRLLLEKNPAEGLTEKSAKTEPELGTALKASFPEIKEVTRATPWIGGVVSTVGTNGPQQAFNESNLLFVDAAFLRLFSFPLIKGSAAALDEPNTVIITEQTAKKYFGEQNPLGKTLTLDNHNQGHHFKVTVRGICRDVPANSHLKFKFLVSRHVTGQEGGPHTWAGYTYVLIAPKTNVNALETQLHRFMQKYPGNQTGNQGNKQILSLQPLTSIHLYSNLADEVPGSGNGKTIWFLTVIAGFILLIAYVNYINLATAQATERAKEVGIRKVLGSQRSHLIRQFFLESFLLNLLSAAFALALVQVGWPWFSQVVGIPSSFSLEHPYLFGGAFLGILTVGALLSGLYPALVLSAYQPVQVLKGKLGQLKQGITLRQSLVVFQFVASVSLMTGTFTVYRQLQYMRSKDLGIDITQTLIIAAPQARRETLEQELAFYQKSSIFKTEISRYPGISGVTLTSNVPGIAIDWAPRYFSNANAPNSAAVNRPTMAVGPEFIDQFNLTVIAGDKISSEKAKQMTAREVAPIMLNEAAVRACGFASPEKAIGQTLFMRNGSGKNFKNEVVGVLRDFHQRSLKEAYTPLIFLISEDASSITHYALKVNSSDLSHTIAQIENTYRSLFPDSPFEHFFLDEFFNQQYQTDQQFGYIFGLFTGLAIFVACLGLFGLCLFTITQRTKEIGVRKVLGASVANIVSLLSRDFLKLVLVANVLAWPLAYWGMQTWLQNYSFRIPISAWLFVVPTLLVLGLALLTVSFQAIKAAIANPVEALRNE